MANVLDEIFGTTDRSTEIPVKDIKIDGGTQMRVRINDATVDDYQNEMRDGVVFPPVLVFYDGSAYWLADGFHRLLAHKLAYMTPGLPGEPGGYRKPTIAAEVRAGTRRDAILHAVGANASHGLKRTNDDKRRAVETLLNDEEWSKWSNHEIARKCAVDEKTVRNARERLQPTTDNPQSTMRTGADGRTINVAKIGSNQPTYAQIYELESVIKDIRKQATAQDLRSAARTGSGHWFYAMVKGVLVGRFEWRKSDLVQALNNVAAQMEAKEQGNNSPNLGTATQPATPTPMIRVTDSELFELAERSACADILSNGKIRNPFSYDGKTWVSPAGLYDGARGIDTRDCVRVYEGNSPTIQPGEQPLSYTDLPGTIVEWRGSKYTIGAEWLIVSRVRATTGVSVPATAATPATLPADLVARGWELRQLSSGRYYCNNASGPRATAVFDSAEEAISAAREKQIDVRVADNIDVIGDTAGATVTAGEACPGSLATPDDGAGVMAKLAIEAARNHLETATVAILAAKGELTDIDAEMCEELDAVIFDLRRMAKKLHD